MIEVEQTSDYARWFAGLEVRAQTRIDIRLQRLVLGNFGDAEPVGEGVSELRIDYGPGYRVYFVSRGKKLVVLLGGGTKRTQARDIRAALEKAGAV